jgi:protein ImuB
VADVRGKSHVVATSTGARARGVSGGMALTEARALAADLVALAWDDERIARTALEVTTALLAASPRVAWAGMGLGTPASARLDTVRAASARTGHRASARLHTVGVWWIDAAGLGSEAKLARKIVTIAGGLGYGPARAGIAESAIAAYAATYSSRRNRRQAPAPAVIPPGTDAAYLAPFPVTLLDLDDDFAATLRGLGLTTLGQLAALDADEVEARFGPEGLAAHLLARGLDSRGPTTPRDDALPAVEVEFGGPVATAEPLLFVLKGALASLGETLHTRGLAAREITLTLQLDDGSTAARAVRPARPTSHPDALFDHCRLALETWQLPEPATGLALSAAVTVPASGEQGDLLAPRWADPASLLAAFERIRGSEGTDAVAVPEARDGHLPADRGAWAPERADSQAHGPRMPAAPPRDGKTVVAALRLRSAPAAVHVRLGRSGLAAFKHEDHWHDVIEWCGPERLAPSWWRHDATAPAGHAAGSRDYYTARTADGSLWLLYRGATAEQWFLEGWLD